MPIEKYGKKRHSISFFCFGPARISPCVSVDSGGGKENVFIFRFPTEGGRENFFRFPSGKIRKTDYLIRNIVYGTGRCKLFLFLYQLLFPLVFVFFLPGLLLKLIRRPGTKRNYPERFALFTKEKKARLKALNHPLWLHAVSVGETNLALTTIYAWQKKNPERRFVLSTTTTTAQEIARKKVPEGVEVIFCPIDFLPFVRKAYQLIQPSGLVIFETEIWPNLIHTAKKRGLKIALVNARMSDRSMRGYRRFRRFFAPVIRSFDLISVQTAADRERFESIAPDMADRIVVGGNIKFDQRAPENFKLPDLSSVFAPSAGPVLLAASTHPGEEAMIADAFLRLKQKLPDAVLVIVPRHAERGTELANMLREKNIRFFRRTSGPKPEHYVDCLLADTTGELMGFIAASDIVIMGKTLAGNNEGQNIIEPAVLGKAIISGRELRNFRQAMEILKKADAVLTVDTAEELDKALYMLSSDHELRNKLGRRAHEAITAHSGATEKNIEQLEKLF